MNEPDTPTPSPDESPSSDGKEPEPATSGTPQPEPAKKLSGAQALGCIVLVAALVGFVVGVWWWATSGARSRLAEADRLWTEGKKAEAAALYKKLAEKDLGFVNDDDRVKLFQRLVEYDLEQGDITSANSHLDKAGKQKVNLPADLPQKILDREGQLIAERSKKEAAEREATARAEREKKRQGESAAGKKLGQEGAKDENGKDEPRYRGKPVSHWIAQLKDSDPSFRIEAIKALEKIGTEGKGVLAALKSTLNDKEDTVRVEGVKALGAIGITSKDVLMALGDALKDKNVSVRDAVRTAYRALYKEEELAIGAQEWRVYDTKMKRDEHTIRKVAVTNDGECVVATSTNGGLWVWRKGDVFRKPMPLDYRSSHALTITKDGTTAVSFHPTTLTVWDVATYRVINQIVKKDLQEGLMTACAVPRKGGSLAVALYRSGKPANLALVELESGKAQGEIICQTNFVVSVAFSPDGHVLASVGMEGKGHVVRLWDVRTGKETATFIPGVAVNHLAFSSSGESVICAVGHRGSRDGGPADRSKDALVIVWDVKSQKERTRITLDQCAIEAIAISPKEELVAIGGWCDSRKLGFVTVCDLATGRVLFELPGHEHSVSGLSFSPDGRSLVSGSANAREERTGRIIMWHLRTVLQP
jgi:WD40 repeat protein